MATHSRSVAAPLTDRLEDVKHTSASNANPVRAIAFHLPQFHPIPENDEWWGRGFTEWINVAKAKPLFPGHYQPHLPADLGFYDLRLPETRAAQAQLAAEYGIYGFCYYHYWFNGRQVLERPVNDILKSGEPEFPFCLCWANENWTRRWDGLESEVLLEQHYTAEDDLAHIRALIPFFLDRRYIRVNGRPFFAVYRAAKLPEPQRTLDLWRREAQRAGAGELFLVSVDRDMDLTRIDPRKLGFDYSVDWQPRGELLGDTRILRTKWWQRHKLGTGEAALSENWVFEYRDLISAALAETAPAYPRIPCVCPGWDNTPRRKNGGFILLNSTPDLYARWLREVANRQRARLPENGTFSISPESTVFINAWNEWAEGTHLEPDQKWGRAYLEATRRALSAPARVDSSPETGAAAASGRRR